MKLPRLLSAIFVSLLTGSLVLAGCSPSPAPTPTPTAAFASEDEAFAAAEETYRAYIDAVNEERATGKTPVSHDYLTGDLLEAELASYRELEASGVRIEGDTRILSFKGARAELAPPSARIEVDVCLDISDARAIDDSGADVTASGRSDVYGVGVTLVTSGSSLLLSEYEVQADAEC